MKLYRIYDGTKLLGAIASNSEEAAESYALGRYWAGTSVSQVSVKETLAAAPICVIFETKTVLASSCNPTARLTVVK